MDLALVIAIGAVAARSPAARRIADRRPPSSTKVKVSIAISGTVWAPTPISRSQWRTSSVAAPSARPSDSWWNSTAT